MRMRIKAALTALVVAATMLLVTGQPAHAALLNMTVGSTWKPEEMSTRQPHYPTVEVSRVFFTGTQCPSWSDSRIQYMLAHNIIPFVSMKLYDTSCLVNFINSQPSNAPWVITTYYHEGEANMDAATWKTRQNAMWNAVKNLPNHLNGRAKYTSVQTRQWTENNGRSYGTYWCGCGDYFSVDMYVNSWTGVYPNASTFISQSLNFANSIGYYMFYPELGSIRMPSDTTGSGRAAWINSMGSAMYNSGKILGVIWWDALGTPASDGTPRDFSLNSGTNYSTPEANAWRTFLDAH